MGQRSVAQRIGVRSSIRISDSEHMGQIRGMDGTIKTQARPVGTARIAVRVRVPQTFTGARAKIRLTCLGPLVMSRITRPNAE